MQKTQNMGTKISGNLKEIIDRRMDLKFKIDDLQREQRTTEAAIARQLVQDERFECFTVNWRAVDRMLNPHRPR